MIAHIKSQHPFDQRTSFGNLEANIQFLKMNEVENIISKDKKMLEIGSGLGNLLNYLLDQGYDIQGTEIDPEYIDKSYKLYGKLPISLVASEILPFDDKSFDIVMSFDVFEHIPDSDNHLKEVKRVLKDGGYYLLQTPNKYTSKPFELIRHKKLSAWNDDHISLHGYKELIRRFHKNGMNLEFLDVHVVNNFFKSKIDRYTGKFGLSVLKVINPDKFPLNFRTNFYIRAGRNTFQHN